MKAQYFPFKALAAMAFGLFPISSLMVAAQDKADLSRILADWQKRQDITHSVRYKLEGEAFKPRGFISYRPASQGKPEVALPEQDTTYPLKAAWLFDYDKSYFRRETSEMIYFFPGRRFVPKTRIEVRNKSGIQIYEPKEANTSSEYTPPKYQPEIEFHSDTRIRSMLSGLDFPVFLAHGIIPTVTSPWDAKQFRMPLKKQGFHIHGTGLKDGHSCVIVRSETLQDRNGKFDEYWVDTSRGSAILRWIRYAYGRIETDVDIDYEQKPEGWFPTKWTTTGYDLAQEGKIKWTDKGVITEFELNPAIDSQVFEIKQTPGMVIMKGGEKRYIVSGDGQTLTDIPLEDDNSSGLRKAWLWGIPIGAAVLTLFWLLLRRRKQLKTVS